MIDAARMFHYFRQEGSQTALSQQGVTISLASRQVFTPIARTYLNSLIKNLNRKSQMDKKNKQHLRQLPDYLRAEAKTSIYFHTSYANLHL